MITINSKDNPYEERTPAFEMWEFAWGEGHIVGFHGYDGKEVNPYPSFDIRYEAWNKGWEVGQEEN